MNSIKILFIIALAFNGEVKAQGDYRTNGTSNSTSNEHNYSFENGAIYEIIANNEKEKIPPGKAIIKFQNGKYSDLMTTEEGFNNLKDNQKLYLSPGRVELTGPIELNNLYNIEIIGNNTSLVANSSNCLYVQNSSDIHIKNCRFEGSRKVGLSLHNIINATIENNQFYNFDYGLMPRSSKNLIVKNNSFSKNKELDIIGDRTQFVNDFTSENSFRSYIDNTKGAVSKLYPGDALEPGEKLVSRNGVYYLKMQQDGNLCLKTIAGDVFIWCMTTDPNVLIKGTVCTMQVDGNLNVSPKEKWVWSAFHKASQLTSDSYLVLTNEGQIKIIAPDGTVKWQNI